MQSSLKGVWKSSSAKASVIEFGIIEEVKWGRGCTQGEDRITHCLQKCLHGGFKDLEMHVQLGLTMFAVYFRHFECLRSSGGESGQMEVVVIGIVGRYSLAADGWGFHCHTCWKIQSMQARSICRCRLCQVVALW